MYLAVDVGGTKTLLALFSKSGQILSSERFPTNKNYQKFLKELADRITKITNAQTIESACFGVPGRLDRKRGVGLSFGNLPWHNIPIKDDLSAMLSPVPVLVENDAKAAALSEALSVQKRYKKVLYLTIGTGIGDGIIINGIIDPDLADSEAGQMVLMHEGKLQKWEDFASGHAIRKKYGKLASEITDDRIWYKYADDLAQGIDVLVATFNPEVVIIGGGVGSHFDKFGHFLVHELKKYENNVVKMPPIVAAKRPEEAVIYGCYELAKQNV